MPKKSELKEESSFEKISRIVGFIFNVTLVAVKILVFLFFTLLILSFFGLMMPEDLEQGNVAVIPITGMITTDSVAGFTPTTDSQSIVELIEKADERADIKAIMLEIDSPGGTPVASDEIAAAVKNAEKPTVALIRETGASGAYWIASAADKIFANRMSITGSIGVRASRLEFAGFIEEHNITYRRLVAGKYKDAGEMFKEMTSEEQMLYQKLLDSLHEEFISTVAENRNITIEDVRELATGFVFLGSEAKQIGLVDELGGKEQALNYLEKQLNITAKPVTFKKRGSILEQFAGMTNKGFFNIGKGIGSVFSAEEQTKISFT